MTKWLTLFLILLGLSVDCLAKDLLVENPWIRQAPPTARNLAGYVKLTNSKNEAIHLQAVGSPLFTRVELHVTTIENGMMRMKEIENLTIKPHETMEFEPGGKHFMLIKPKQPIKAGLIVPVILQSNDGEKITINFIVRK